LPAPIVAAASSVPAITSQNPAHAHRSPMSGRPRASSLIA
jgi:hypothetical protein